VTEPGGLTGGIIPQQNVVTPVTPLAKRDASYLYDVDCEGMGIGHIMQKLNVHLSSGSVRLSFIDHNSYF
jgi:hypothetical protein